VWRSVRRGLCRHLVSSNYNCWRKLINEWTGICDLFDPVTLTLTRWPLYTHLTHVPGRHTECANMNFLCESFSKLSSDICTSHIQRDRHTDRQALEMKLYTLLHCGWSTIIISDWQALRRCRPSQKLTQKKFEIWRKNGISDLNKWFTSIYEMIWDST